MVQAKAAAILKPQAYCCYVKDFKSMKLGSVQLSRGKGELTLRAVDKPGSQVMEFRLLMFTRK